MSISISGTFVSAVNPGPKSPPRWSRVKTSFVPALPAIEIVSVFVVVAPRQTTPANVRSLPETLSEAEPPGSITALAVFVPAS